MIQFENGGRLVQSLDELPNLQNSKELFLDLETTSFDPKVKALEPYHGHRTCGICVTADDHKGAWYVPIRSHRPGWNLDLKHTLSWLDDTINTCTDWVNHNIKFDAHFLKQDNIDFNCRLVDTNTLAKIVNSDRFSHDLDSLSTEWLEEDIGKHKGKLSQYLDGCKSKDYGDVPGDIIGEYGCQDVITNRKLWKYLLRRRHEQTKKIWETEILLTPVLFDMEVIGLHVNKDELMQKQLITLHKMLQLEERLHSLCDFPIRPHTNADCYEVLCTKFGLPVLGYTDKNEPSFDKAALLAYLAHPVVKNSKELLTVVTKIQQYRKLNTFNSLFLTPYLEYQVNGIMHPSYNQIIRTGRMSCRRPNSQQLSYDAKALAHPPKETDIGSWDYSQIEFRIICHYINDRKAIAAYADNPNTDFHQWVSDMCQIPRKPAKNVNFAIAFGGGKSRVVSMLSLNMDLVSHLADVAKKLVDSGKVKKEMEQRIFELLAKKKGEQVYNEYHNTLPGIRSKTKLARDNLVSRGFVFNAYGRQRHLPDKASYRAFNTVVQSCAADVIKERTVAMAPRYNRFIRELGIKFFASVHDETALYQPKEVTADLDVQRKIKLMWEDTKIKFRVPMIIDYGMSGKNWAIASNDEGKVAL